VSSRAWPLAGAVTEPDLRGELKGSLLGHTKAVAALSPFFCIALLSIPSDQSKNAAFILKDKFSLYPSKP